MLITTLLPAVACVSWKDTLDDLRSRNVIQSAAVYNTMRFIDRADFSDSLQDWPASIGYGQTISAPHMHAMSLEHFLKGKKECPKVLDVGSGSGYLTACFAQLVQPCGSVTAVEIVPQLLQMSKENIAKSHANLLQYITLGSSYEELDVLFDYIYVGAAAKELPANLFAKLKEGGVMLIPIGQHSQALYAITKVNGQPISERITDVRFVPLL